MYFIFAIFSPSSNNKNDSLGLDYANDIYKDSSDYDSESKYSNNDIGYRYVRSDGIAEYQDTIELMLMNTKKTISAIKAKKLVTGTMNITTS